MELYPISFNDHKPLLLMRTGKADSPIKGLGLLRISHGDARSDCVKDWLARWCGWHVVLFSDEGEQAGISWFIDAATAFGANGRRI